MDKTSSIAENIVKSLGIDNSIRNIYFEKTDSPWNEKALIKRKKDYLDVKVTIWDDKSFLFGRIYRLFLYIYDVLNPQFQYNPQISPDESIEPRMKDRHNQIWSIFVDSRIEKRGIENFFNKAVRKNIFIDAEKGLTWGESSYIFEKLWDKASYTYPEITDYTYNLPKLFNIDELSDRHSFELDINRQIQNIYVKDHIDAIKSPTLRNLINEILSFTAFHCKDIFIKSSHFGILINYHKMFFAEIIPTNENTLILTIVNPLSHSYDTEIITENSNIETIQQQIRGIYNRLAAHG